MKLEKGKWYKWFQTDHGTAHIGKFDSISEGASVKMKPWIIHTTSYNVSGSFERQYMQDIVEITDLTEIQKLLPDGHEDKVKLASAIIGAEATKGVLLPKSEFYIATMKFFEQLREPERSEAIENYDEDYPKNVPLTLRRALVSGFEWGKSKQGCEYWDELYNSICNITYFKEPETEMLVFGKYKIGDIVVNLTDCRYARKQGGLFAVMGESTINDLYYETYYCSMKFNEWRAATPEEVTAYNEGVRNISEIKTKPVILDEALLEEAKRRYPVGTTYKCSFDSNDTYTVRTQAFSMSKSDTVYGEYNKGHLFHEGKWAEIISQESPDVIPVKPTEIILINKRKTIKL